MKRIHWLLTGLSITIILLSLNRLTNWTQTYLQPYDFLRVLDFNAMLPIPLISIILYWLLKEEIVKSKITQNKSLYIILHLVLIAGIYFFGAGSGTHEFANYLDARFCDAGTDMSSELCRIIIYNDDSFSHYVYYLGFILLNISLIGFEQINPRKENVKKRDLIIITANSLFIALGIFANTAFEEASLDLVIFSAMMFVSLFMLTKKDYRKLPITFYFAVSYTVGVVTSVAYKLV